MMLWQCFLLVLVYVLVLLLVVVLVVSVWSCASDDQKSLNSRGLEVNTLQIWDPNNMIRFSVKKSIMMITISIFKSTYHTSDIVLSMLWHFIWFFQKFCEVGNYYLREERALESPTNLLKIIQWVARQGLKWSSCYIKVRTLSQPLCYSAFKGDAPDSRVEDGLGRIWLPNRMRQYLRLIFWQPAPSPGYPIINLQSKHNPSMLLSIDLWLTGKVSKQIDFLWGKVLWKFILKNN